MNLCRSAALIAALAFPALYVCAQDEDEPFAEQLQDAEFKQVGAKQETQRLNPPAVVAPGPEGPASPILVKDRLMVLRDKRAAAVQQKKSSEEIAAIDAEIKSLQEQLGVF